MERGPEPCDLNVRRDGGVEIVAAWPYSEGLGGGQTSAILAKGDQARRLVSLPHSRLAPAEASGKFAVDAVRIQADYCPAVARACAATSTFTIDAPLDKPKVYEQTVFLRRGGEGFNPDLRFRWNIYHPWRGFHDDGGELIRTNPEMRKLYWAGRQSAEAYSRALETKQPPEKIAEAMKKRDEAYENLYRFALTFRGPVNHLNPEVDAKDVQRSVVRIHRGGRPAHRVADEGEQGALFQGSRVRRSGIRPADLRPLSAAGLSPAGDRRTRSTPRCGASRLMQEKHGKSFPDAVRAAVASVLVSPAFPLPGRARRDR